MGFKKKVRRRAKRLIKRDVLPQYIAEKEVPLYGLRKEQELAAERRFKMQEAAARSAGRAVGGVASSASSTFKAGPIELLKTVFNFLFLTWYWWLFISIIIIFFAFPGLLGDVAQAGEKFLEEKVPGPTEAVREALELGRQAQVAPGSTISELNLRSRYDLKNAVTESSIKIEDASFNDAFSLTPILGRIRISARNLIRDTQAYVSCTLDNEKKNKLEGVVKESPLTFKKDLDVVQKSVECAFPVGLQFDQGNIIRSGVASVKYPVTAESSYKIFYVDSKYREDASSRIKDPDFKRSEDGGKVTTTPKYESPVQIAFSTDTQPVTNDESNLLMVHLTKKLGFLGDLIGIHALNLYVPSNIELIQSDSCAFTPIDQTSDGDVIYTLKQSQINRINFDCSSLTLKGETDVERCKRIFKDNIFLSCSFMVHNVPDQELPEFATLRAVADYDFEATRTITVSVYEDFSQLLAGTDADSQVPLLKRGEENA